MGPLDGIRVIEIASLAPAPFGCMILSDLGADVLRVERAEALRPGRRRPGGPAEPRPPVGRASTSRIPTGSELLLRLVESADVLVEGFRPGVTERLGFGPEACAARNPRLVYGRMTGWGQDGPLAPTAGHDIDYIAVSGALYPIGRAGERPVPPLNLVGDFGGGGMLLALGVLAALVERERSGRGQVVDAAMVDGSALLTAFMYGLRASGRVAGRARRQPARRRRAVLRHLRDRRRRVRGGGRAGAEVLRGTAGRARAGRRGAARAARPRRAGRCCGSGSPRSSLGRTRDEWAAVFAGSDGCVAPVLSPGEAPGHPHNAARGTFADVGGVVQPAPAPRFGRSAAGRPVAAAAGPARTPTRCCPSSAARPDEITALRARGTVG